MNGHLVKPFSPQELYAAVESKASSAESEVSNVSIKSAKANPTINSSLIDREKALEATGGNEELAKVILETCIEESPKILDEARRALANRDFKTARRCGHSLKSSFGAIGATKAAEASEVLEFLQSEDAKTYAEAVSNIQRSLDELTR
jgi:HPt (histidine-containing phosphotransfer) domain-containing protein